MRSRFSRSAIRHSALKLRARKNSAIANKRGAVITCIFLVGIVWIVFGQTLQHDFVNYDDADYVYENSIVSSGLSFDGILWAFSHVHAFNWHPLTTISHMLDCQFYGLEPWGHHFTNVLLHAATAVMLFLALCELTRAQWPSAFVAALFAIHPLRVSSVAWVAERKDVLSGLFFMLTLWAYGRYVRQSRGSSRAYITALVFLAAGLMCKPSLVTLPFVLLLLDYWPLRRIRRSSTPVSQPSVRSFGSLVAEKIPFFALSAASCVATLLAQRGAVAANVELPLNGRIGNAVVSYAIYLGQTFWPVNLAAIYPYPAEGVSSNAIIASSLVLLIITVAVFIWRNVAPFLLTGWLWFVGVLVPMIGIIMVGNQARADRYTYLAQIGLDILLAWGAVALFKKWRYAREVMIALTVLILTGLAADSYYQTTVWRNSESLWKHAVAVTKNNYIAHHNLGTALRKEGRLDEAIAQYREALDTCTRCPGVYNSLGFAYGDKREWQEALEWHQRALQSWPGPDAGNNNNIAIALVNLGRTDEALEQFREALRLDRSRTDARYNFALLLKRLGRIQEAKAEFKEVLRLMPDNKMATEQLRLLEAEK